MDEVQVVVSCLTIVCAFLNSLEGPIGFKTLIDTSAVFNSQFLLCFFIGVEKQLDFIGQLHSFLLTSMLAYVFSGNVKAILNPFYLTTNKVLDETLDIKALGHNSCITSAIRFK